MDSFRTYLKNSNQTIGGIAEKVGISANYMSEIANFKKKCPGDVAFRIAEMSGGLVPFGFWYQDRQVRKAGAPSSHMAMGNATSTPAKDQANG